jgi:hypothetical protein
MWEIGYTITPDEGHFDRGERALWRAGIYQQAIRSLEFVADGTVVLVYEFDCSAARLESVLGDGGGKVVDYAITKGGDRPDEPLVAQIRLRPDETLQRVLSVHRSFGVSVSFPIRYLRHDPATIEIVETGPRAELSERIAETRAFASVEVRHVREYEPTTPRLFGALTDRQQEVLETAVSLGYYEVPRETTHEEIAAALDCSASVVGQHLRRIERRLVSAVVPGADEEPQ